VLLLFVFRGHYGTGEDRDHGTILALAGALLFRGATEGGENGVARPFAARRIGIKESFEGRKDVSVTANERGVALVTGGFFRDGEPLPW
jgi:hypothetical protein